MVKYFMVLGFMLTAIASLKPAHAIDLLSHKSTGSSIVKIDDAELEKVWASGTPACLKDGSKLMGVNKAFRTKALKYSDCSASDNAKEKQRLLGYEVAVIRLTELSDAKAKQVMGIKN